MHMSFRRNFVSMLVAELLIVAAPASRAQVQLGNSPPVDQVATLSGMWVLKGITLASGAPLPPALQVALLSTRVLIDEKAGTAAFDGSTRFEDTGKPPITCQVSSTGPFTIASVANHAFLRLGPALQSPSRGCGRFVGMTKTNPAQNFMFEVAGNSLTTISFTETGAVLYIYMKIQPGSATPRN